MTNINMYNAVCYDGVDSYVIKTLGRNEEEARKTFDNTDLEVLKLDKLYTWADLDEHIKGSWLVPNPWELGDGNNDIRLAILRYIEVTSGICLQ